MRPDGRPFPTVVDLERADPIRRTTTPTTSVHSCGARRSRSSCSRTRFRELTGPVVRRRGAGRARPRPHTPACGRAARRAHRRHGPGARVGRQASAWAADRDLAGERSRALPARRRPARRAARSELLGRRALPHRRRGHVPLRDGEAWRIPVGEPPERVASEPHPLLALRARLHGAARDADVLSRATRCSRSTRSSSRSATSERASGSISRFDLELTTPDWALGYRFDIVLGGREATPLEEPHDD